MPPDPADADSRSEQRHELLGTLTVISAQTQLLRRRVQRAGGLSTTEREQMLHSISSTLTAVLRLTAQIEHVLPTPGGGELTETEPPS